MTIAGLLLGLALLVGGAELLVRGAVRAAECFGVSPLLIGLTLVGFGTSTPELVASVQAALIGSPGIAVGNIVGSNLANMLLILGASAVITPLAVPSRALKRDGAFVLGATLLFVGVGLFGKLDRPVGVLFAVALVGYLIYAYRQERRSAEEHTAAFGRAEAIRHTHPALRPRPPRRLGWLVALVVAVAGLGLVIVGGRVLVESAVVLARHLGMSEAAIGLTIVAVGTSTPELVTALVAAFRKQADVALGNVLGSNIYNLLGIGAVTALIAPTPVPPAIARVDAPLMLGVTVLLVLFAWTSMRVGRREGAVLLALYAGYTGYQLAA